MSTNQSSATAMSPGAEIRLVAARELRTQFKKKSSLIAMIVMMVLAVGGILAYSLWGQGSEEPYRLGVTGSEATTQELGTVVQEAGQAAGEEITVSELGSTSPEAALAADAEDGGVDMVLDLSGQSPRLIVEERARESVTAVITSVLQQAALSQQITDLGGDPRDLGQALATAAPTVDVLNPPTTDREGFGVRYAVLITSDILLLLVLQGGGQAIAMGVVEEKSSRIVEILLACVRPTSLLAGKVIGIGIAVITSFGAVAVVAALTARITGVMPDIDLDLNTAVLGILLWMVVGYAFFALLYGAAGSLVSRQEDIPSVSAPLTFLIIIPYVLSFTMISDNPDSVVWRILSYVPPLSAFLMPARLTLGGSSVLEQGLAMLITLATLPLLVRLAATIYTRAIMRTGSRVRLKEVLRRSPQAG